MIKKIPGKKIVTQHEVLLFTCTDADQACAIYAHRLKPFSFSQSVIDKTFLWHKICDMFLSVWSG